MTAMWRKELGGLDPSNFEAERDVRVDTVPAEPSYRRRQDPAAASDLIMGTSQTYASTSTASRRDAHRCRASFAAAIVSSKRRSCWPSPAIGSSGERVVARAHCTTRPRCSPAYSASRAALLLSLACAIGASAATGPSAYGVLPKRLPPAGRKEACERARSGR